MADDGSKEHKASPTKPKRSARPAAAKSKKKRRPLPMYHVVLYDDNDHTHEYVIEMLKALFAHPEHMGMALARKVDTEGTAIIFTTHRELAELKRDQVHAYGADRRVATCRGSMSAGIIAAE